MKTRFHRLFATGLMMLSSILFPITSLSPIASATDSSSVGKWEQVSAAEYHTCAIGGGNVYCWGNNDDGQLGNGTKNATSTPQEVGGLLTGKTVTYVSASQNHTCALADAKAYCWGYNGDGELGDGSTNDSMIPVAVSTPNNAQVTQIKTNFYTTCMVASGEAYCWGFNRYGQLGDGTTTDRILPTKVMQQPGLLAGKSVSQVSILYAGGCALAEGNVYCWGEDYYGELGDGANNDSLVPVQTTGILVGKNVTSIDSNNVSTCSIAEGSAYCWGDNGWSQIDDPNVVGYSLNTPTKVSGLGNATVSHVSVGETSTCAITSTGVFCWGDNENGINGDGTQSVGSAVPSPVQGLASATSSTATSISDAMDHACAINGGQLYCWGYDGDGVLGYPDSAIRTSSTPMAQTDEAKTVFSGKTITDVSVSFDGACAVANSELYCWGNNGSGIFGNGTNDRYDTRLVPTKVTGALSGKTVTKVSSGDELTCAIASGQLYCWGWNGDGELGIGNTTNVFTPTLVAGALAGKTVTDVSVTLRKACAVADGEAYCWGTAGSYYGGLGDGTSNSSNSPVKVAQDSGLLLGKTVTSISTNQEFICAVASGSLYCWGHNYSHQLADPNITFSLRPIKVGDALASKTVQSVAIYSYNACAVADNEAYCWGDNYVGELGDGTTNESSTPLKVSGVLAGKTVLSVSKGGGINCALATDGVYCWGSNDYGQLGDGTTTDSLVPVKITTGLPSGGVQQLSQGTELTSTCALASNNIYCWGRNYKGVFTVADGIYSLTARKVDYVLPAINGLMTDSASNIAKRPTFTGVAEPGSTVVVTVHSDPVTCTTTADSNGNWSCTLPSDLPAGQHTVNVVVTTTASDVINLGPYTVTVAGGSTLNGNINSPDTGGAAVLNIGIIALVVTLFVIILGALVLYPRLRGNKS